MHSHSASFRFLFLSLVQHRSLVYQMTKREVIGRYKGSLLGLLWSFFNPVLMLAVYTFVFSVVFKSRWPGVTNNLEFAGIIFAGLIVYSLFSECVIRAPMLVLANVNFVKKVVFPLEILPWVAMAAGLFHACISIVVLLVFLLLFGEGAIHWTIVFFPLVMLPLLLVMMGVLWGLASLGVYVRDIGQGLGIIVTAMLFLSPIFYPATAFPEAYQILFYLNPLTFIIEQSRAVLLWGDLPDWSGLGLYFLASLFVAWLGFTWFQKTRKGFADVI